MTKADAIQIHVNSALESFWNQEGKITTFSKTSFQYKNAAGLIAAEVDDYVAVLAIDGMPPEQCDFLLGTLRVAVEKRMRDFIATGKESLKPYLV